MSRLGSRWWESFNEHALAGERRGTRPVYRWIYAGFGLIFSVTFVVLVRAVHSLVHCSYNKVMHRFAAYVAGALVLWAMWARLAWHLLA